MADRAPRRSLLFRGFLVLVALVLGVLGWDVWQLRSLRPPEDRTFEGFLRDGRRGEILIDSAGGRLYWVSAFPRTVIRYSQPPVYEFDRSGKLVNWTPGTDDLKGMFLDVPVRRAGRPATEAEARAWLRPIP